MIIDNAADIQKVLNLLNQNLYWTYDDETTGLKVRHDKIIGFGSASNSGAFYIITHAWKNGQLIELISKEQVLPVVEALKKKRLITFNGSYDSRITYHYYNVNLIDSIYADVMLMAHTISENRMDYKLKNIAADVFGNSVKQAQQDMLDSIKANGGTDTEYYKADAYLMAAYGIQDNLLTLRLYNYFLPKLREQGLFDFFFKDEVMPLYRSVTIPVELYGVPIDLELMQQTLTEITADIRQVEAEIHDAIRPHLNPFLNWFIRTKYPFKMTGGFKTALAARLAPANWPRTATGGYSFAEVDLTRAIKKGLISADEQLYKYAKGVDLVPQELIRDIQLQLMKEDGLEHPFNLSSKTHLKKLFFVEHDGPLNEEPLSRTEKGAPQVDDSFLEVMAKKYDWASKLQVYNKLIKIKGTYIERFLDKQENGIFYPSLFQHRTTSGRYSGDLQQLSRPLEAGQEHELVVKYTNLIRRFFISGEGHTFADYDYDSQEVKVFAHVSGEQAIKDIFAKGEDFYSGVCIRAEKLVGYSADKKADNYLGKVNKAARQRAKAYALGLAFNMSPYKLKFELNCSESEAQEIYNAYFTAFPDLKKWLDNSKEKAMKDGFIRLESGRLRRLPELKRYVEQYGMVLFDGLELWKKYHDTPALYAKVKAISGICKNLLNNAANVQIQGLAASITNRAAIKAANSFKAAGLQSRICNVIHDQITVLAPNAELELTCKLLQDAMETAYPISVKLTAPPSTGINWAESK